MADAFKPGQLVRLRSGGPLMTVVKYQGHRHCRKLLCKWFDVKKEIREATFTDAELETDEQNGPPPQRRP